MVFPTKYGGPVKGSFGGVTLPTRRGQCFIKTVPLATELEKGMVLYPEAGSREASLTGRKEHAAVPLSLIFGSRAKRSGRFLQLLLAGSWSPTGGDDGAPFEVNLVPIAPKHVMKRSSCPWEGSPSADGMISRRIIGIRPCSGATTKNRQGGIGQPLTD